MIGAVVVGTVCTFVMSAYVHARSARTRVAGHHSGAAGADGDRGRHHGRGRAYRPPRRTAPTPHAGPHQPAQRDRPDGAEPDRRQGRPRYAVARGNQPKSWPRGCSTPSSPSNGSPRPADGPRRWARKPRAPYPPTPGPRWSTRSPGWRGPSAYPTPDGLRQAAGQAQRLLDEQPPVSDDPGSAAVRRLALAIINAATATSEVRAIVEGAATGGAATWKAGATATWPTASTPTRGRRPTTRQAASSASLVIVAGELCRLLAVGRSAAFVIFAGTNWANHHGAAARARRRVHHGRRGARVPPGGQRRGVRGGRVQRGVHSPLRGARQGAGHGRVHVLLLHVVSAGTHLGAALDDRGGRGRNRVHVRDDRLRHARSARARVAGHHPGIAGADGDRGRHRGGSRAYRPPR